MAATRWKAARATMSSTSTMSPAAGRSPIRSRTLPAGGIDRLDFSQLAVAVTRQFAERPRQPREANDHDRRSGQFRKCHRRCGRRSDSRQREQQSTSSAGPAMIITSSTPPPGLILEPHTDVVIELPGEGQDEINFADLPAERSIDRGYLGRTDTAGRSRDRRTRHASRHDRRERRCGRTSKISPAGRPAIRSSATTRPTD